MKDNGPSKSLPQKYTRTIMCHSCCHFCLNTKSLLQKYSVTKTIICQMYRLKQSIDEIAY